MSLPKGEALVALVSLADAVEKIATVGTYDREEIIDYVADALDAFYSSR